MFNATVAQKTERNSLFEDLCLSVCWAINAPGHPSKTAE